MRVMALCRLVSWLRDMAAGGMPQTPHSVGIRPTASTERRFTQLWVALSHSMQN